MPAIKSRAPSASGARFRSPCASSALARSGPPVTCRVQHDCASHEMACNMVVVPSLAHQNHPGAAHVPSQAGARPPAHWRAVQLRCRCPQQIRLAPGLKVNAPCVRCQHGNDLQQHILIAVPQLLRRLQGGLDWHAHSLLGAVALYCQLGSQAADADGVQLVQLAGLRHLCPLLKRLQRGTAGVCCRAAVEQSGKL